MTGAPVWWLREISVAMARMRWATRMATRRRPRSCGRQAHQFRIGQILPPGFTRGEGMRNLRICSERMIAYMVTPRVLWPG